MKKLASMTSSEDIKATFEKSLKPHIKFSGTIDVAIDNQYCDFTFMLPVSESETVKSLWVQFSLTHKYEGLGGIRLLGDMKDGFPADYIDIPYPCDSMQSLRDAFNIEKNLPGDVEYLRAHLESAYGIIQDAQKYVITPFIGRQLDHSPALS
jgi:hypothetical protein